MALGSSGLPRSSLTGRPSLNISYRQVPTFKVEVDTPPDTPTHAAPPSELGDATQEASKPIVPVSLPTAESIAGMNQADWEREFAALQNLPGNKLCTPIATDGCQLEPLATTDYKQEPLPTADCTSDLKKAEVAASDASAPSLEVASSIAQHLQQVFDEESSPSSASKPSSSLSGFKWTGIMDAAQAAWIGGTQLLKYGELLPGGVAKAVKFMVNHDGVVPDALTCGNQLVLELGAGRGRLALQLFLMGAAVVGVELASERYGLAVAALERLSHRFPEQYDITKRTSQVVRLGQRGGPRGAVCEVRLGNFLNKVSDEEIGSATLVFCQVCLPSAVHSSIRTMLERTQVGCRILMYERLESMYGKRVCPFKLLAELNLACTWQAQRGHRFYCYERLDMLLSTAAEADGSSSEEEWESTDGEGSDGSDGGRWV
mmetsp:Transcript_57388/g.134576  ORF Transcript_57388/g.134576 Transcript_57388/m.134576 type:complete len:431 (+) Transcript_57388:90-1382(+)